MSSLDLKIFITTNSIIGVWFDFFIVNYKMITCLYWINDSSGMMNSVFKEKICILKIITGLKDRLNEYIKINCETLLNFWQA